MRINRRQDSKGVAAEGRRADFSCAPQRVRAYRRHAMTERTHLLIVVAMRENLLAWSLEVLARVGDPAKRKKQ